MQYASPTLINCPNCNCEFKLITCSQYRAWALKRKTYSDLITEDDVNDILQEMRSSEYASPVYLHRTPGWAFISRKNMQQILTNPPMIMYNLSRNGCTALMRELIVQDAFKGQVREYRLNTGRGYLVKTLV